MSDTTTLTEIGVERLRDVYSVDVRERGTTLLRVEDAALQTYPEEWERPARTVLDWQPRVDRWEHALQTGGQAWGAYDANGVMIGIAVLDPHLDDGLAELVALFVSRRHRRQGIARSLTARLITAARRSGAQRLYVTSFPSPTAVAFYTSLGFTLAHPVHPRRFAEEPHDIHMTLEL
jgi:GNAT superfamily N-acetyltransferase